MGYHQDGFSILDQPFKDGEDRLSGERIEATCRLIGDDHRGVIRQRTGDRHALLLASGDLRRVLAGMTFQPYLAEQIQGTLATLPAAVEMAEIHGK